MSNHKQIWKLGMSNYGKIQTNLTKRYLFTCLPPEVYHKNRPFQHGSEVPSLSSIPRRRAWLVDGPGIEFLEDQIVLAQELHDT